MTPQPVIRLCVRTADGPAVVASETRSCVQCAAEVWYDPRASIPALGPEVITCAQCFEDGWDDVEPEVDPCNFCDHDNTRHRSDGCLDCGCAVPQ